MASTAVSTGLQTRTQVIGVARIAIAALAYFAVTIVVLHFIRLDLNPISRPTSAYAVGPYSFLMTSAFFSMSVASFALVIGFYRGVLPSTLSRIGLVLLSMWAVGVLIAMIFPMDPEGAAPTISGTIHQTDGPPTFLCLSLGMIFMSWAFQRDGKWRPFYRMSLALSFVMLAAFIATFLSFATDSGTVGIAQRIALATAVTWMLLTAGRLRSMALGAI
jgi:hypothetical protein